MTIGLVHARSRVNAFSQRIDRSVTRKTLNTAACPRCKKIKIESWQNAEKREICVFLLQDLWHLLTNVIYQYHHHRRQKHKKKHSVHIYTLQFSLKLHLCHGHFARKPLPWSLKFSFSDFTQLLSMGVLPPLRPYFVVD